MSSIFERLKQRITNTRPRRDLANQEITCPECGSAFPQYEVLKHNLACPQCGSLLDVNQTPKVFS